jgi:hypothetical protein
VALTAADEAERLRPLLADWPESGERVVETSFAHGGEPVRIGIRKRGFRYDLSDEGEAVRRAGAKLDRGLLELAKGVVAEEGMNVNRRGTVFVQVVEGRDLANLAARLAETSVAVYDALLEDAV